MKIWKLYSVGQSPKVAAHATEWRRVLGLARSIGAYRACVKMCKNLEIISDKKKRVRSRACALTRRTTTAAYIYIYIYNKQKIPLERTTRLARSRSPIIYIYILKKKEKRGAKLSGLLQTQFFCLVASAWCCVLGTASTTGRGFLGYYF